MRNSTIDIPKCPSAMLFVYIDYFLSDLLLRVRRKRKFCQPKLVSKLPKENFVNPEMFHGGVQIANKNAQHFFFGQVLMSICNAAGERLTNLNSFGRIRELAEISAVCKGVGIKGF